MQVLRVIKILFAAAVATFAIAAQATTAVKSVIHTFPGDAVSPLIQAHDGNFYGTSPTGGSASHGYVFRLTPAGTATVLYSFLNGVDGGTPRAGVIEGNDGNLYGTNTTGASGNGTLFRMTLAGAITSLHPFASATDGNTAGALIENNAGDFFGAATSGGSSNSGTVFEYTHTGTFVVIHTFTGTAGDGALPNTQLLEATDGYIYGATRRGGSLSNSGSLFHFNPAVVGSFATFASFPPTGLSDPDYNPSFGMTEGQDGNLYGLTAEGGVTGYGSIYRVIPGASPSVTLNFHSFVSFSEGGLPASGLFLGGDGNFYGTTSSYGPGGPPNGTVFQFIPSGSGVLSTLYAFSSPEGDPAGAPIEAADSNFYGPAFSQIYKLVTTPTVPPPVVIGGSSASITLGTIENLDWQVRNGYSRTAANCWAHGDWSGSKALTGTESVTPAAVGTYHYALTCGGVESASYTVVVTPPLAMQTATPVITPGTGSYTGPVEYQVTDATPGAVIHYTTDGTAATLASPVWNHIPKVLVASTIVRAIAIAPGFTVSNPTAAKFTIKIDTKRNCSIGYLKGFSANPNLILNHGASVVGTTLELTHGLLNENTSAFAIPRIPLALFASEFHFRFYKAVPDSADGLTFTIQANSPNALGGPSSGLGYAGITHSMALKFDLHNNAGEGANSVGLFFGGTLPTVPAVDLTPSGINLHSGHILDAYVTYDTHHVVLNLKDTVTAATFTHTFTLPVASPFGTTTAYAGFTASTGAQTSYAQVLDWTLESQGPCGKN